MRTRLVLISAVVLAIGLGLSPARAEVLDLGPNYSYPIPLFVDDTLRNLGGGSIDSSTLGGKPLLWVYCVDLFRSIWVPGAYDDTVVTSDGEVHGEPVNKAEKVAWLLTHYAAAGQGLEAKALQAAIWITVWHNFGHTVSLADPTSALGVRATEMLTELGSNKGNVANFLWLSPKKAGSALEYQGLVTRVPDGGVTLMLLGGALVALATLRRRLRA